MYTECSGSKFLGYGRNVNCENCHNTITEHVYYNFAEYGILYFRLNSDVSLPVVICPICNHNPTPSDVNPLTLTETLEIGKDHTITHVKKMSWIQKKKYLQDLKKLCKVEFGMNGKPIKANEMNQFYSYIKNNSK